MDIDALPKLVRALREDVDKIIAWIGKQSVEGFGDGLTAEQKLAKANGESVPEIDDQKPVTRAELKQILEDAFRPFGDMSARVDAIGAQGVEFMQFRESMAPFEQHARGLQFAPVEARSPGSTIPPANQAHASVEEVALSNRDGVARPGADANSPALALEERGQATGATAEGTNSSGTGQAMSASSQAPESTTETGVNGRPTVEGGSTATAEQVKDATSQNTGEVKGVRVEGDLHASGTLTPAADAPSADRPLGQSPG